MVKKGSIFSRLAERLRHGSGVKVEEARDAGRVEPRAGEGAHAPVSRLEPRSGRDLPAAGAPAELRSTRKLSEREDAMVAFGSHFQELSALLRGAHSRMDSHLGRLVENSSSLQQLPALSNQQLDVLRGMAVQLEKQNIVGEQMASMLHTLPQLLQGVEKALQRAQQSDERTSATMREFQSTMDRIHSSMGRMVDSSEEQARATQSLVSQREDSLRQIASGLEQSQRDAVQELRAAADDGMQTLRRSHEDQSNRLQRVVQEHASWNKAVLAVLGVVALGMIASIAMLVVKL